MMHLKNYSYICLATVLVACSQPTPPPEIQPELRFNKLGELVAGCTESSSDPCLPPPPGGCDTTAGAACLPPPPTPQRDPSGGEGGSGASGGGATGASGATGG